MTTLNVSSHLAAMAATDADRVALLDARHATRCTFAELHADSDAIAHGLNALGVTVGTRVAVMVPPSLDFFRLTFALLKMAAVPVLIDPGMGVKNLGVCLAEAEPEAFIGIAKAHVARRLLRWSPRTIRTTVNVGRSRFFCHRSLRQVQECGHARGGYNPPQETADTPAAILFTSGSTGIAKGAVYSHGIFSAQVAMLRAEYGIEPGEVDLCTFSLFALFGPALGMTCVIPEMNAARPATIDARKTLAAVERYRVTNLFGSPAVLRRFAELPQPQPVLSTVRRVISAGAPATTSVLERVTALLPAGVQVYTPYGATEALPVTNMGSAEVMSETAALTAAGRGVCVGRPFPGMQIRIVPITDEPIPSWVESACLPTGQIGEIVVRGPVVTREYFRRDAATRLAKILDPATGDVLHRMGDVGYLDEHGRLWFCGRKSHRVVTPQRTLFTDCVEPIFNKQLANDTQRTALVGVTRTGITHAVVCIELPSNTGPRLRRDWETERIRLRSVAATHEATRGVETFLIHPGSFPVDVRHNSKIFREKLARWADRTLGPSWRGPT